MRLSKIAKNIIMETAAFKPKKVIFDRLSKAIDKKERVSIMYMDTNNPENRPIKTGRRIDIEPVALGLSTAGNTVVRAYVFQGTSRRGIPNWKMFRLDRIARVFVSGFAISDKQRRYFEKERQKYNPSGDRAMAKVFKVAKF